MEGAIEAVREGAFDYVSKPFKLEQILAATQRAAKHWESLAGQALRRTARGGGSESSKAGASRELIGKSPRIIEVYKTLAHATLSNSSVLLQGESGSGKGMVARAIHEKSSRSGEPFITLNGMLAPGLQEFEAFCKKSGKGTLYVEEVADLMPAVQSELLHLLEEDRLQARLIAATQKDLEAEVRGGGFREDLFYQLKVITIGLPPLRERLEDLPELVDAFVARYSKKNSKDVSHVAGDAMELLGSYSWPGNIRELEHAIERAVVLTRSSVLFKEDFSGLVPNASRPTSQPMSQPGGQIDPDPSQGSLEAVEKQAILKVLSDVNFNKSRASEVLGIDRATLYRKAQRYGIDLRGK
jgi:DNA-binding NtrC family response regulator